MKFIEMSLSSRLMQGITDMGFVDLTPVQEKTLPASLAGRDMAVQSQTGTGKTAAFLITIIQRRETSPSGRKKALIIVPTRELAVQVEKEAKLLGRHLNLSIGSFYGGVGYRQQETLLKKGVDIIVATPGRLLDLNQKGVLNLRNLGFLVIDEADRLFDMGFLPAIRRILRRVPPVGQRQTMLFSATLSGPVLQLSREYMKYPEKVTVAPEQVTVDTVTQELYHVSSSEKINLLLGILHRDNPRSALIFTNMKHEAEKLSRRLNVNGFSCEYLTGDLAQSRRLRIIDDFKSGRLFFLIATDVAARGLHIEDLDLVVNFDLPEDSESYIHRIGRTARAGKAGKAVSLACEQCVYNLEGIEALLKQKIPVQFADDDLFLKDHSQGMIFKPKKGEVRHRGKPPAKPFHGRKKHHRRPEFRKSR